MTIHYVTTQTQIELKVTIGIRMTEYRAILFIIT